MRTLQTDFSGQSVINYFDASFIDIQDFSDSQKIIIITENNIFNLHPQKFEKIQSRRC